MAWIPLTPAAWKGLFAVALGMLATTIYRPVFGEIWEWWNLQSMESSVQRGRVLTGLLSYGPLLWLMFLAYLPTVALALLLWHAVRS